MLEVNQALDSFLQGRLRLHLNVLTINLMRSICLAMLVRSLLIIMLQLWCIVEIVGVGEMGEELISEGRVPLGLGVAACSALLEHLVGGELGGGDGEEARVDATLRRSESGAVSQVPEIILLSDLFHFAYYKE